MFFPLKNAIWPFATYNRVWLVFRKYMLVSKHCKESSQVSLKADITVNSVIMLSTKPPKMWTGVLEEFRRNQQRNSVISCWPFIIIKTLLKGTSYMVIRHTVIQYHNCFGTTNLSDDYKLQYVHVIEMVFFSVNTVMRTKKTPKQIRWKNICPY